jgi:UDP-N-acetylglucosamine 4,6-dehydratase
VNIIKGRTILVTGGTGSFGQCFVRTALARWEPRAIRVFSRDELKQAQMAQDLRDDRVRYLLGDVRSAERLRRAAAGVDIVIHAAALKQVPACEYNPFEAIQTNVLGAQNVADACLDAQVGHAVALSTDKAVNPVNLYGATKLCAEKLFIQANVYSGRQSTRFSCVRYGNVIGSRGSVMPLFQSQLPNGELTVTDPRMTRFWISLDQAVGFVVDCVARMRGGEVFVPKIPSMRVVDLAAAVGPGLPVRFTGIRPGEKLHEALLTPEEVRRTLDAGDAYIVQPEHSFWEDGSIPGAAQVAEDFVYTSQENTRWLGVDDLRGMVAPETEVSAPVARAL